MRQRLASAYNKRPVGWLAGGGVNFVIDCLKQLLFDCRAGIKTLGLYRIGGVNSKVQKLMTTVFCKRHLQPVTLDEFSLTRGHTADKLITFSLCLVWVSDVDLLLTC